MVVRFAGGSIAAFGEGPIHEHGAIRNHRCARHGHCGGYATSLVARLRRRATCAAPAQESKLKTIAAATAFWPHGDYPPIDIGVLELNRNPENYFNEIE